MYAKFKLNGLTLEPIASYELSGRAFYERKKAEMKSKLGDFVRSDGIIDGSAVKENWFPLDEQFDIFLSHSHNDEKLAVALAGFLKEKFGLKTFIDSCLWGHSNDLLKKIDDEYCKRKNGHYNYDKRNYSTGHVHMMLSVALSQMIDRSEAFFFLNTPNSLSVREGIRSGETNSPWIFNEVAMSNMIRVRSKDEYRSSIKHSLESYSKQDLTITYDLQQLLKKFYSLSWTDLSNWEKHSKVQGSAALDYIYAKIG